MTNAQEDVGIKRVQQQPITANKQDPYRYEAGASQPALARVATRIVHKERTLFSRRSKLAYYEA
jgi:hypothetical protein